MLLCPAISIIAIHFCHVLQTLTSPSFVRWPPSVSRDDGCTRLSRCRPGRVVWRSWSAQSPGPPLGVAGRVRRKGKPIRSVPVQLQELPEGVAMLDRPPSGLHSGFTTLQLIQDRLACVVTKSPPSACIVPQLHSFHCIPVKF